VPTLSKQSIYYSWINAFGYKSRRKIIVFESDDWGSIRIPSKKAYNSLLRSEINVAACPYSKYDVIETYEDFAGLFDVLNQFKDYKGEPLSSHSII